MAEEKEKNRPEETDELFTDTGATADDDDVVRTGVGLVDVRREDSAGENPAPEEEHPRHDGTDKKEGRP
jgi:hypothetical protein